MDNQQYAPPKADLASSEGIDNLLVPLLATKPWVRLCSVLGFISTGLMVLGALAIIGVGSFGVGELGARAGISAGVLYLFFAGVYFMPSLFLFRYASAIAQASNSKTQHDVTVALEHQRAFWKFVGILSVIMLIFMGLLFLVMIIGLMAAMLGK